jgi:hypothetical protein
VLPPIQEPGRVEDASVEPDRHGGTEGARGKTQPFVRRLIVEFCCYPDSRMSDESYGVLRGDLFVRVTLASFNPLRRENFARLLYLIRAAPRDTMVVLWTSTPCTWGSPQRRRNSWRANYAAQDIVMRS